MQFSNTALKDAIMVNSLTPISSNNTKEHYWIANQQQFGSTANRHAFVQSVLETNYDQIKRETPSVTGEQERSSKRFKVSG